MRRKKSVIEILCLKEIKDILRDKKTLVIMVLVPLLLYPAMIMGLTLFLSQMGKNQLESTYYVVYDKKDESLVQEIRKVYEEIKEEEELSLEFLTGDTSFLEEKKTELFIKEEKHTTEIRIEYNSTNQDSSLAHSQIKKVLGAYEAQLLEQRLRERGLEKEFFTPIVLESKDEATHSQTLSLSLGGSLGMLLITTIMTGAFYPTIDVTTGEKERGTLETLLTLPVSNFQMILSKFMAVSLFAGISALLSILSIGGSLAFLFGSLAKELEETALEIDVTYFLSCLPLLLVVVLVTALLLAAVSMCFCIFAKSFKEANNYFTPVMLVIMFASMVSMLPSVELELKTALIPIVNVSLLIKAVIAQNLSFSLAMVIIFVNLAYSILTVWVLAKIYSSENVLFQDGFQSFNLFEKRSRIKPNTIPKTGDLLLATAVLLLLLLYLGLAAGARSQMAGALVNQLLILSLPLFLGWYMKLEVKTVFSCNLPKAKPVTGAVVLYVGTYSLVMVLSSFLMGLMPESTGNMEAVYGELLAYPLPLLLLVMAFMPAVGEELFFRGLLFGSWKYRLGPLAAMVVSSLIFGGFHMSLVKLLPTAMLGLCFSYVVWKTGSIYPSMILHFMNNLLALMMMKYEEEIGGFLPILVKAELEGGELLWMTAIGTVCIAAGILVMGKGKETLK